MDRSFSTLREMMWNLKDVLLPKDITLDQFNAICCGKNATPKGLDVKHFQKWGLAVFQTDAIEIISPLKTTRIKEHDETRQLQMFQNTGKIWSELRRANIIPDALVQFILDVLDGSRETVHLYANIIIHVKPGAPPQKFHADHAGGPHKEVVLAIDLSGSPLNTRYLMGSHLIPGVNFAKNIRGVAPCLARWKHILEKANGTSSLSYVEATQHNMILFDAGGLHSGNHTDVACGPRVFFTFRHDEFHESGAGQTDDDNDVWGKTQKRDVFTGLLIKN